jgi:DNA mismatch repair ATPase MutL
MPLNRLSEQSVQQLTSDQVATSLHAVIKELLEYELLIRLSDLIY